MGTTTISRLRHVEIMDSTLRDGEQTNGVSFLPHEKLVIARELLHDVNVDRIEPYHTYSSSSCVNKFH